MKIGSLKEDNICSRVPLFLDRHSAFHIERTKSYSLLCRPERKYLVFSPVDIAIVVSPQSGRFFAVFEYNQEKYSCKETSLEEKYGCFPTVVLNSVGDSRLFKDLIPGQGHRS
ncbi:hypothetical protein PHPALM_30863 [Phytophthora palmivora]|uniref:Uncharacterized protein n=1 Tax=Phytophthora palmivora TaxID=4796 RepID=A0A2P4X429_9STRA|nr:hypothetical protein PHPALM_30863 [Phytophthora palmivora]